METKRKELLEQDRKELGIKAGSEEELSFARIIPYYDGDKGCARSYCEAEQVLDKILPALRSLRAIAACNTTKSLCEAFLTGYDAAKRDILNILKIDGLIEVDLTDCGADDLPPFNVQY